MQFERKQLFLQEQKIIKDRLHRQPLEFRTNPQSFGIGHGPTAFCSGGIFLLVVGTALLLPGRDITGWQPPDERPEAISSVQAQKLKSLPVNLAPDTPVFMVEGKRVRNLHWQQQCPLVANVPLGGRKRPLLTFTYAQVQMMQSPPRAYRFLACDRCRDLEFGIDTTIQN